MQLQGYVLLYMIPQIKLQPKKKLITYRLRILDKHLIFVWISFQVNVEYLNIKIFYKIVKSYIIDFFFQPPKIFYNTKK